MGHLIKRGLTLALILFLALSYYNADTISAVELIRRTDLIQQTEETSHSSGGGLISPVNELPQPKITQPIKPKLPSAYNNNILAPLYQSPVKEQRDTGLCWSYAAMAAIESSTIKHGGRILDLSEAHAAHALSSDSGNKLGFDRTANCGGWTSSVAAYLMRGELSGAVRESDDPLTANIISARPLSITSSKPAAFTVPNAYVITGQDYNHARDADKIKEAVMRCGAVSSYMMISDEFYWGANAGHAYYFDGDSAMRGEKQGGHVAAIIGWDDDFSKYNFPASYKRPAHAGTNPNAEYSISRPDNNGAWLIKNSWGTSWFGLGGYAWISFEDAYIGRDSYVFDPV